MAEAEEFKGWTGRFRPGPAAPWRPVVSAATERECWERLLDFAAAGDKCVLASGRIPAPSRPLAALRRGRGKAGRSGRG